MSVGGGGIIISSSCGIVFIGNNGSPPLLSRAHRMRQVHIATSRNSSEAAVVQRPPSIESDSVTDVMNFSDDFGKKDDDGSLLDDDFGKELVPIPVCRTRTARAFVKRTARPHEIGISKIGIVLLQPSSSKYVVVETSTFMVVELLLSSFSQSDDNGEDGGGEGGDMEERHEAR